MSTDRAAGVDDTFRQAVDLHRQSRLDSARVLYERTLELEPRHFHAQHLLGVVALQQNHSALAVELIRKALLIEPASAAAYVNHGTALYQQRRLDDAVKSYEKAIELAPSSVEALYNHGNALRELERYTEAVVSYDRAVALKPDYADAYLNRGLALSALTLHEAAIASYERASAANPNLADPHYNRGNEYRVLGRHEAAVASYDRAIALQPGFADAHLNRGSALVGMRRYAAALTSYDHAIALRPRQAEGHFNRAAAFQHRGDHAAAVAGYDTAIAINPQYADAHANRGFALRELRRYETAVTSYDKAISFSPNCDALRVDRRHIKMQICDWKDLETDIAAAGRSIAGDDPAANPFFILALCDSAAMQKRAAEKWARTDCPRDDVIAPLPKRGTSERIHVGYFSADLHEHATAYLIAQLFELHDRTRFRVSVFSFGPHSDGPMRRRLKAACDEFVDLRDSSDTEAAMLARNKHIDIAVDLKGFTQGNRVGIFARRAAPLQLNYLGYPGTMGAPYMDYLVADRILVPPGSEDHYTEKIIRLPHSYQVNDATREIAAKRFTRDELGLPTTGFVFCCFNNTYKILPAAFDRWMRVLGRVPGSVLWLLGDNQAAVRNLRREAAARDVAPERLVFADRIDQAHHLARHRAANLVLDTLPCNAHTTASDALWAGVPVLTCPGESFSARVAASLVSAVGLAEMIAPTPDHYEELAVRLATHPQLLDVARQHLRDNQLTAPLFDTPHYCRHLEAAYSAIYERHRAGLPPDHIQASVVTERAHSTAS